MFLIETFSLTLSHNYSQLATIVNSIAMIMTFESIAAIVGAVGGTTAIIEMAKYLATRKATAKMADTEATRDDFHLTQELMGEIKDKTRLIRELNEARLADAKKIHELQLDLYDKECRRRSCAFRQPLKPFTPLYPPHDMSVFEYFNVSQKPGKEDADID